VNHVLNTEYAQVERLKVTALLRDLKLTEIGIWNYILRKLIEMEWKPLMESDMWYSMEPAILKLKVYIELISITKN
jgi:hypothetical protein